MGYSKINRIFNQGSRFGFIKIPQIDAYIRSTTVPNKNYSGVYMEFTPRKLSTQSDNHIFRFTNNGHFNNMFMYRNSPPGDASKWLGWLTSGSTIAASLYTMSINQKYRILWHYNNGWYMYVNGQELAHLVNNAGPINMTTNFLQIGGVITGYPMELDLYDMRFFTNSLTKVQMQEITNGKNVNTYLTKNNCPLIYNNFNSEEIIKNNGNLSEADLIAHNCIGGND